VSQRRDEVLLLRTFEWIAHDDRDVDVAAALEIAAQGAGAGEVDAHELVAEHAARALDQLVEIAG
jgi:hypothetical protein